jgi:hypothetical protein
MDNIKATDYGHDKFYITYDKRQYKVYKVGWYISGVGESYVLCIYFWKPKYRRKKRNCNLIEDREYPDIVIPVYSGGWCEYDDQHIKRIIKALKMTGKSDLDMRKL